MKKLILFGLLLLSIHIYSENLDNDIELWVNNQITISDLIERLQSAKKSTEQQILLGKFLYIAGDSDRSLAILEPLYRELQKRLNLEESAELYSNTSEVGTYIMIQKGVRFIISNSSKVNTYAEQALEMNPNLIKAEIIILNGLINAPKLFGGDKKKGVSGLKNILKRGDITNLEKYETLSALITSTKDKKEIESYVNEIKKIYPGFQLN